MWKALGLGLCLACSTVLAVAPADLDSPFLKRVIFQKTISGYGAGPVEKKEVLRGQKKTGFYEFEKGDGSLLVVSDAEMLGVLPIFPSILRPCDKSQVEQAIRFLETAKKFLPGEDEVSDSVMEKWRRLFKGLEQTERELIVSADLTDSPSGKTIVFGIYGLLAVLLGLVILGFIFLIRKKRGPALLCLVLGVAGGLCFWYALQPPPGDQTKVNSFAGSQFEEIFLALSCAKEGGGLENSTEYTVELGDWLNFLFTRVKLESSGSGWARGSLHKPYFQTSSGVLEVQQPVQSGPFCLPWLLQLKLPAGEVKPENFRLSKAQLGPISFPADWIQPWLDLVFQPYRNLWLKITGGKGVQSEINPDGRLTIRIRPTWHDKE